MIDVPIRVKDALKEGNLKKNYRFVVYKSEEQNWFEDIQDIDTTQAVTIVTVSSYDNLYISYDGNEMAGAVIEITLPAPQGQTPETVTVTIQELSPVPKHTNLCLYENPLGVGITITITPSGSAKGVVNGGQHGIVEVPDFTIDNNNLISESVAVDERMCSDSEIKFGLCEGTYLDFQCFDIPNITGRRLKAYIDVEYKDEQDEISWYPITLGWFDVKKCSRNPDTGRIKISCYNKLLSDYLDNKANTLIQEQFANEDTVIVGNIISTLLGDYAIEKDYEKEEHDPDPGSLDNWISNPTSTFNYNSEYGWQGPLGAGTRGYIRIWSIVHTYTYNTYGNPFSNPVKISVPDYFDALDDEVYNLVKGAVYLQDIDMSKEDLLTEIVNLNYPYTPPRTLMHWLFSIAIINSNSEIKLYGNTLYEYGIANGTFSDLNKLTFTDVTQVIFFEPLGLTKGDSGIIYSLYGEDQEYRYKESVGVWNTHSYPSPKYPDGGIIPYNGLVDKIHVYEVLNMSEISETELDVDSLPDVTLRDLQSAVFETQCQFGRLDRETDLFYGMELNNARLYPAEDLYPANDLYPISIAERVNRAMYEKLWCDEGQIKNFRNLIITYKGTEEQSGQTVEVDKVITKVVNADGTDDYICDDNWLFRNLVWTDSDMEDYADAMVTKMQNITWFPFELWCAGLPYIETGDELEINIGQHAYTSYVLRRNLNGIQDLHDEMECGELEVF